MGARWRKWGCFAGNSPYVKTIHTNKQTSAHLTTKTNQSPQQRLTEVPMKQSLRDQTQTRSLKKTHLLFLGAVCKKKGRESSSVVTCLF